MLSETHFPSSLWLESKLSFSLTSEGFSAARGVFYLSYFSSIWGFGHFDVADGPACLTTLRPFLIPLSWYTRTWEASPQWQLFVVWPFWIHWSFQEHMLLGNCWVSCLSEPAVFFFAFPFLIPAQLLFFLRSCCCLCSKFTCSSSGNYVLIYQLVL